MVVEPAAQKLPAGQRVSTVSLKEVIPVAASYQPGGILISAVWEPGGQIIPAVQVVAVAP